MSVLRYLRQIFEPLLALAPFAVLACAPPAADGPRQLAVDQAIRVGTPRRYLETSLGGSPVVYLGAADAPADEFARATVREMLAAGKAKPVAYQVFLTRRVEDGRQFRDYVFYDRGDRAVYVARWSPER